MSDNSPMSIEVGLMGAIYENLDEFGEIIRLWVEWANAASRYIERLNEVTDER